MIEIEIKAKVQDKNELITKINKIGGKYIHTEKQHDTYFNAPNKDYAKTDEALRIREIPVNNSFEYILTYKGPKLDSKSKTRKEIEVTINDTENMKNLLINLGFKPSAIVNKTRRVFKYNEFTITLDHLDSLGYYSEIEYVAEKSEDIEKIRNEILNLFNLLGITDGFERTSYLELLENLDS